MEDGSAIVHGGCRHALRWVHHLLYSRPTTQFLLRGIAVRPIVRCALADIPTLCTRIGMVFRQSCRVSGRPCFRLPGLPAQQCLTAALRCNTTAAVDAASAAVRLS